MVDREPEDELRDLWARLDTAPEPPEDPLTDAAVQWARRAWDSVEAPAMPALPVRRRGRLPLGRVAAAAVIAVGIGVALWSVSQPSPAVGHDTDTPTPVAVGADPDQGPAVPEAPQVTGTRPDGGIEFKSGPVRLVLVHASVPDAEEADAESNK